MAPGRIFDFPAPSPPGGITHAQALAARTTASCPARHPASLPKYSFPHFSLDCTRKGHKLNSRCLALKVYPHEIDIQETQANDRKLDSQATLSHRARGRAVDGLRSLGLGHLGAAASGHRQARDHFRFPLNHLVRPSFPPRQLFLDELD